MCMIGCGPSELVVFCFLFFCLLENHVARTVHVSRSSHVTEHTATRLGHTHTRTRQDWSQGARRQRHRASDRRHAMPHSVFLFARHTTLSWFWGGAAGVFVCLPLSWSISEHVDVSLSLTPHAHTNAQKNTALFLPWPALNLTVRSVPLILS